MFRSGFLPRILGLLLFVSGFGYLAISGTGLLFPLNVERLIRIASPTLLGEGGVIFWLLIKGARPPADRPETLCNWSVTPLES